MKIKVIWNNQELKSLWVSLTKEERVKVRGALGMNLEGDDDTSLELKADVAKVKELLGGKVEEVESSKEEAVKKRGRPSK